MNRAILSLLGCSGSIAGVLASGTIASPDTTKTIPYPEVMNLQRVPVFDARGIVPGSTTIASGRLQRRYSPAIPRAKLKVVPLTLDLVSQAVREPVIKKSASDRLGDRTFAPTSMMVLGYSSPSGISVRPRTMMY